MMSATHERSGEFLSANLINTVMGTAINIPMGPHTQPQSKLYEFKLKNKYFS